MRQGYTGLCQATTWINAVWFLGTNYSEMHLKMSENVSHFISVSMCQISHRAANHFSHIFIYIYERFYASSEDMTRQCVSHRDVRLSAYKTRICYHNTVALGGLGTVPISDTTSQIDLWYLVRLLWSFTDVLAPLLPMHLSYYKVVRCFKLPFFVFVDQEILWYV